MNNLVTATPQTVLKICLTSKAKWVLHSQCIIHYLIYKYAFRCKEENQNNQKWSRSSLEWGKLKNLTKKTPPKCKFLSINLPSLTWRGHRWTPPPTLTLLWKTTKRLGKISTLRRVTPPKPPRVQTIGLVFFGPCERDYLFVLVCWNSGSCNAPHWITV